MNINYFIQVSLWPLIFDYTSHFKWQMYVTLRPSVMPVGLQISSMLTDWSSPLHCPVIIRLVERDRDGAESEEPCLSVMEDSYLHAAISNGPLENMRPNEEGDQMTGNGLAYKLLTKPSFYTRH